MTLSINTKNCVNAVAVSPDGKTVAVGQDSRAVTLWEVSTGEPVGLPLVGNECQVLSVAWHPEGSLLAGGGEDNSIHIWDVSTGERVYVFRRHKGSIESLAFSPDGSTLASGSYDGTVRIWDISKEQVSVLPKDSNPIWSIAYSVCSVAFSPDGSLLASAKADGTIHFWDTTSGNPVGIPLRGHSGSTLSVAFSPDGSLLASVGKDRKVKLWDVSTRGLLASWKARSNSVTFSPDGSLLVTGGYTVNLWGVATGNPVGLPEPGHHGWVSCVAFTPDGKTLITGGYDQTVRFSSIAGARTRIIPCTFFELVSPSGETYTGANTEPYNPVGVDIPGFNAEEYRHLAGWAEEHGYRFTEVKMNVGVTFPLKG